MSKSKLISLHCAETPGLKLGPGVTESYIDQESGGLVPGDVIVFRDGFATFESENFPDWERWVKAPGSPSIRVVDTEGGEATDALEAIPCPVCDKPIKSEIGMRSHLRVHAPAAATTGQPKDATPKDAKPDQPK